jgi:hypothetical protein
MNSVSCTKYNSGFDCIGVDIIRIGNPEFTNDYPEFMETYERLGHMDGILSKHISALKTWYLPHHALMSTAEKNKKFRVVFDVLCKHGIVITRGIL